MALYDEEDILGMTRDEEIICRDCMSAEDWNSIKSENEIISYLGSEVILFCDKCKKRIPYIEEEDS